MEPLMRILVSLLLAAPLLSGSYSGLIATSDGSAVYFTAVQHYAAYSSQYVARGGVNGSAVTSVSGGFTDVDGSGSVVAVAATAWLQCQSHGSTCLLADQCGASFQMTGSGFRYASNLAATTVQLSRSGQF